MDNESVVSPQLRRIKSNDDDDDDDGVNIKTGNWFTSFQFAANLLQKQITFLGAMRKIAC